MIVYDILQYSITSFNSEIKITVFHSVRYMHRCACAVFFEPLSLGTISFHYDYITIQNCPTVYVHLSCLYVITNCNMSCPMFFMLYFKCVILFNCQQVAIKVVNKQAVAQEFVTKFLPRELENHSQLQPHKNVVSLSICQLSLTIWKLGKVN